MIQETNPDILRTFFGNSPLATQVMSPQGEFIYVNQAFTDIWNRTIDDLIGVNIFDDKIVNRKYILPLVKRAFQGESIILPPVLISTYKNQSQRIWIRTQIYSVFNAEHEISYVVMMHEDVTENQTNSEALTEARRKAETLLSNLPGMAYQCSYSDTASMIFVSNGSKALTGYEPEDLIENKIVSFVDLIHPEDRQEVLKLKKQQKHKHEHFEVEYRIFTKEKEIKWVSEKGVLIDGKGTKGTVLEGFISDITEKKLNRKALEDNENLLKTLIDTLPVYIWLKDINGFYITCNHNFELFYGTPRNEIIGRTDYDFVPEELADFFRKKDMEALHRGVENTNEEEVTHAGTKETILFRTTKKPMYDSQGNLVGILGIGTDITEWKKTETDLIEKQQQLQSIFEDPNTFLGTLNLDGTMISCNDTALNFIGRTLEDLRGIPFWDTPWWTHDQIQRLKLLDSFPKALKGKPCSFETFHVGVNEEIVYIDFSIRPIRDAEGHVYRFLVEGQNTTERKLVEDALKESEVRFSRITENAQDMIYRMSLPDGRYEYVNSAATKIFGLKPEDFYNKPFLVKDLIHPDWMEYFKNQWELLLKGEMPTHYQYQIINARGEMRWIHQRNVLVKDSAGKPIAIEGIATDITETKQQEEALRLNEARYRAAQALGHVGNWEYNLETTNFWGSDESKRIYGFDLDSESFTTDEVESCIPERESVHTALVDLIERDVPYNLVFDIITKDKGERKTIRSLAVVEKKQDGTPYKVTGLIQDITDRVLVEKQLEGYRLHLEDLVEERTRDLQEANRELESFSYSVSHDLRAPLRAINGFCNYLAEDYMNSLDCEGQRLLNTISENAVTMDTLITDILNLSRISRQELCKSLIDMNKLVQATFISVATDEERQEFEFILSDLPPFLGDGTAMKQVWSNLIGNALKYSAKSAIKRIQVGFQSDDKNTIYYIKDWGIGFNNQYKDKLFGVFQRLHSSADFSGTGVGLAIVERIIRKHDGCVWAEGEVSKGATFYLSFPKLS
jgi:PAS domain S-box-containing protein